MNFKFRVFHSKQHFTRRKPIASEFSAIYFKDNIGVFYLHVSLQYYALKINITIIQNQKISQISLLNQSLTKKPILNKYFSSESILLIQFVCLIIPTCLYLFFLVKHFPASFRNRLIFGELEPVISHTEKLYPVFYAYKNVQSYY